MATRSYLSAEDMDEYKILAEGVQQVEAEKDELDKEMSKQRFELGARYLEEFQNSNTSWSLTHDSEQGTANMATPFISSKEWRAEYADKVATLKMVGQKDLTGQLKVPDLETGELLSIGGESYPRNLFNLVILELMVRPKSSTEKDKEFLPGLTFTKKIGKHEQPDEIKVSPPSTSKAIFAFPEIEPDMQEKAMQRMIELGHALEVPSL